MQSTFQEVMHEALQPYTKYRHITWSQVSIWKTSLKIKKAVNIPVIGVGRVNMPALANKLIEDGEIDMIAIGRAQLADPEWCNKAREGREDEIRRCIGCTEGCYDKVIDPKATHITCTRNPMLCLEYKGMPKAEKAKNVMVIGGGIGGTGNSRDPEKTWTQSDNL